MLVNDLFFIICGTNKQKVEWLEKKRELLNSAGLSQKVQQKLNWPPSCVIEKNKKRRKSWWMFTQKVSAHPTIIRIYSSSFNMLILFLLVRSSRRWKETRPPIILKKKKCVQGPRIEQRCNNARLLYLGSSFLFINYSTMGSNNFSDV